MTVFLAVCLAFADNSGDQTPTYVFGVLAAGALLAALLPLWLHERPRPPRSYDEMRAYVGKPPLMPRQTAFDPSAWVATLGGTLVPRDEYESQKAEKDADIHKKVLDAMILAHANGTAIRNEPRGDEKSERDWQERARAWASLAGAFVDPKLFGPSSEAGNIPREIAIPRINRILGGLKEEIDKDTSASSSFLESLKKLHALSSPDPSPAGPKRIGAAGILDAQPPTSQEKRVVEPRVEHRAASRDGLQSLLDEGESIKDRLSLAGAKFAAIMGRIPATSADVDDWIARVEARLASEPRALSRFRRQDTTGAASMKIMGFDPLRALMETRLNNLADVIKHWNALTQLF